MTKLDIWYTDMYYRVSIPFCMPEIFPFKKGVQQLFKSVVWHEDKNSTRKGKDPETDPGLYKNISIF